MGVIKDLYETAMLSDNDRENEAEWLKGFIYARQENAKSCEYGICSECESNECSFTEN